MDGLTEPGSVPARSLRDRVLTYEHVFRWRAEPVLCRAVPDEVEVFEVDDAARGAARLREVLGDALDDRQPEADACAAGVAAFIDAEKRGKR